MRGLDELLRARINVPIEELNPFLRIEYAGTDSLARVVWDHAHCMPVAVGLALQGLEKDEPAQGIPQ